jgi:hypothetical protein
MCSMGAQHLHNLHHNQCCILRTIQQTVVCGAVQAVRQYLSAAASKCCPNSGQQLAAGTGY